MAADNVRLVSDSLRLLESLGELPEPIQKPFLIVLSGLPGTGKSFLCQKLAERLPVVLLESDALRKALYPSLTYGLAESSHLFAVIHLLLERLLAQGHPVVLDATNLSERNREPLYGVADRLGVKLVLVQLLAPPELVKQRLETRTSLPQSRSDAGWDVYRRMLPTVEKISREHYTVDSSRDIGPVVDKIVRDVSG